MWKHNENLITDKCELRPKIATTSCDLFKKYFSEVMKSGTSSSKEGNVLFNDALNTFYLQLYGVGHMVKNHSDSERGNPLPPHGLFFPISSKGYFICTIPQTG